MRCDIIAQDAKGRDVLLVEVKTRALGDDGARSILASMRGADLPVRFGMVADPGDPSANQGWPSARRTMVGVMDDTGRLPGPISLRAPGCALNPLMMSFSNTPVPLGITCDP